MPSVFRGHFVFLRVLIDVFLSAGIAVRIVFFIKKPRIKATHSD